MTTIIEHLRRTIADRGEKPASICRTERLTYSQLGDRISRFSNSLKHLGVNAGDRVAILSLNCHRFFEIYYAVPQIGAVIVPINFRIPAWEVKYIVDHSEACAVVVDDAMAPLLDQVRPQLESVRHFISIGDAVRD
ncbi:MAG TPA: AMP-binding protein, partial [Blastocatellia bacterium]|nr:AMP-binding protein [Blastocatellia bacterium]